MFVLMWLAYYVQVGLMLASPLFTWLIASVFQLSKKGTLVRRLIAVAGIYFILNILIGGIFPLSFLVRQGDFPIRIENIAYALIFVLGGVLLISIWIAFKERNEISFAQTLAAILGTLLIGVLLAAVPFRNTMYKDYLRMSSGYLPGGANCDILNRADVQKVAACYYDAVVITNDSSLCRKSPDIYGCLARFARRSHDYYLCEQLVSHPAQTGELENVISCLQDIGYLKRQVCGFITNMPDQKRLGAQYDADVESFCGNGFK